MTASERLENNKLVEGLCAIWEAPDYTAEAVAYRSSTKTVACAYCAGPMVVAQRIDGTVNV